MLRSALTSSRSFQILNVPRSRTCAVAPWVVSCGAPGTTLYPSKDCVFLRTTLRPLRWHESGACRQSTFAACRAVSSPAEPDWQYTEPGVLQRAKGWLAWAAIMTVSFPVIVAQACVMALQFLRSPKKFTARSPDIGIPPDPIPGVHHGFLEVNGVRLHVASTGKAPGKSLMLMLHGFPESWVSWRHQMEAFSSDYHVAAVDLRGYGQSSRPKGREPYQIGRLVEDIKGLVAAFGHQQCVLVAHDWGGALAWAVAYAYPSIISKLSVMCGPHPAAFGDNLDWDQLTRSWYIAFFQWPWFPEMGMSSFDYKFIEAAFIRQPMGCKTTGAISPDVITHFKHSIRQPYACTAALNYYRALMDSATRFPCSEGALPSRDHMRSRPLQMPTMVLWADSDGALGQQLLKGLPDYVPDIQIHTLRNCSHWIQQDRPDEVNRLMERFLEGSSSDWAQSVEQKPAAAPAA